MHGEHPSSPVLVLAGEELVGVDMAQREELWSLSEQQMGLALVAVDAD